MYRVCAEFVNTFDTMSNSFKISMGSKGSYLKLHDTGLGYSTIC